MVDEGARRASSNFQGGDRFAQEAGNILSPALIDGLVSLATATCCLGYVHVRSKEAGV